MPKLMASIPYRRPHRRKTTSTKEQLSSRLRAPTSAKSESAPARHGRFGLVTYYYTAQTRPKPCRCSISGFTTCNDD
eukprot:s558_g2.t1